MKTVASFMGLLIFGAFVSCVPVRALSSANTPPIFDVKIQTEGPGSPKFTVTNLTGKAVSACVITFSVGIMEEGQTMWDALTQGDPKIEPDADISLGLPHAVGGPLPDRVEVVAGVWADGETFGDPKWVERILKNRELTIAHYDEAIALLREGMDQKWTRDQYLHALGGKPDSVAIYSIRSTLKANPAFDKNPERANHTLQRMLDSFTQKSSELKAARPIVGPSGSVSGNATDASQNRAARCVRAALRIATD
jgi:hypothetical protein